MISQTLRQFCKRIHLFEWTPFMLQFTSTFIKSIKSGKYTKLDGDLNVQLYIHAPVSESKASLDSLSFCLMNIVLLGELVFLNLKTCQKDSEGSFLVGCISENLPPLHQKSQEKCSLFSLANHSVPKRKTSFSIPDTFQVFNKYLIN